MSILKVTKSKNLALVYTQTSGSNYRAVVIFATGVSKLRTPPASLQLVVQSGEVTVAKPDGSQLKLTAAKKLILTPGKGGNYLFENKSSDPCVCLTQNGNHGGPPYVPDKPPE